MPKNEKETVHPDNGFADLLPRRLRTLHQRIYDEITKFLTDPDESKAVLYFHWPTEELTNRPDQQLPMWQELCETCAMAMRHCMRLLSTDQYGKGQNGEQYFLLSEAESGEFLYIPMNNGKGVLCHRIKGIERKGLTNGYIFDDRKRKAIDSLRSMFRVKTLYGNGMQFGAWLRNCREEVKILHHGNRSNWESAILYAPYNLASSKKAGQYLYPAVEMSRTDVSKLPERDIAAVIGDKAFEALGNKLKNQLAPYGPLHKLIVFASCATGLDGDKCKIVDFTFKEAYDICMPKRTLYNKPKLEKVKGAKPAADLSRLYELLKVASQEEDADIYALRHIYNVARAELCSINFSKSLLESFQDRFGDFIEDHYPGIGQELLGKIEQWTDSLEYDKESNPKKIYLDRLKVKNVVLIDKERSIARQVSSLPDKCYTFVVDAPRHSAGSTDNVISKLMRYHLFDRVICLYYEGVEDLLFDSVQRELKKDKLFNAGIADANEKDGTERELDIADYDEGPALSVRPSCCDNEGVNVTFNDGTSCLVYGDVLVHCEDGSLEQITIDAEREWEGKKITYYRKEDYFDEVVRAYLNLPDGRSIDDYSRLWHDKLKCYLSQNENSNDMVCQLLNVEQNYLNRHLTGNSRFMNRKRMSKLLEFLSEKGLISDEDKVNVMRAYNMMMREHTTFGARFKDALLAYRRDQQAPLPELLGQIIERHPQGVTIEALCDKNLHTNTIKTIE